MKVLFYLQSLSSGGAERVTATLANYWASKGWKVVIVTVENEDCDFYALDPRVERMALGMAIKTRNTWQAVLNNLRRSLALWKILRRDKPDITISMMAKANSTLALCGHLARVPTIGSERIYPPTLPLGRIWEGIRRQMYPLLSGLVAQTEDSAAWLQRYTPTRNIRVIPNPVNYPLTKHDPCVDPMKVLAPLAGQHVLLASGRLDEQKGFDNLLKTFAKISGEHPDWSMVILGQGHLHAVLMQEADELGIRDRVAFPGAVGNVGEWLETADLYALTSRFEGFPNTLLEALAYGVPSVAVDCETGPREIVRHEVDGLLVPQADLNALTAALNRLMTDAALRARFSGRAVEVRERFAVERIAAQWEVLFQEVTASNQ